MRLDMKRIVLGYVSLLLILFGMPAIDGCAALDKAAQNPADQALVKTGTTILCVLEEEEIDDPALNVICNNLATNPDAGLTDAQQQIVARHIAKKAARAKAATERLNQAQSQDGGAK